MIGVDGVGSTFKNLITILPFLYVILVLVSSSSVSSGTFVVLSCIQANILMTS